MFLCLVKLTLNKTNDCLFDCQLREVGNLSKFQHFRAKNDIDLNFFLHWPWPLITTEISEMNTSSQTCRAN